MCVMHWPHADVEQSRGCPDPARAGARGAGADGRRTRGGRHCEGGVRVGDEPV